MYLAQLAHFVDQKLYYFIRDFCWFGLAMEIIKSSSSRKLAHMTITEIAFNFS